MAIQKIFAYNTGSLISGTTQVGDIAVSEADVEYSANYGGLQWWGGPDETVGYVIAHTDPSGSHNGQPGIPAYLGFWRSNGLSDSDFLTLCNSIPPRIGDTPFTNTNDAYTWLNSNGYWTSYVVSLCDSFTFNSINANTTTTSAIKTSAGGWDSSAYSVETYTNPVTLTFQTTDNGNYLMGGFSYNPTGNTETYTNITYGIYLQLNFVEIYENGAQATVLGAMTTLSTDVWKVEYNGTNVTYYKNDVLIYTSSNPVTQPLHVFFPLLTGNEGVNNVCLTENPALTPTPTVTTTPTETPTNTPTPTVTNTSTETPTPTPTVTPTNTITETPTNTPTPSVTNTQTPTLTPTVTPTNPTLLQILNQTTGSRTVTSFTLDGVTQPLSSGSYPVTAGNNGYALTHGTNANPNGVVFNFGGSGSFDLYSYLNGVLVNYLSSYNNNAYTMGGLTLQTSDQLLLQITDPGALPTPTQTPTQTTTPTITPTKTPTPTITNTPTITSTSVTPTPTPTQGGTGNFNVTISQQGPDVVWNGSGFFNLAALSSTGPGSVSSGFNAGQAIWAIGVSAATDTYSGTSLTYPTSFGTGGVGVTSSSGSTVGILPGPPGVPRVLYVPSGYVSNTTISGGATYANNTIAGMGLSAGTYTWNFTTGGNSTTLVMNIVA